LTGVVFLSVIGLLSHFASMVQMGDNGSYMGIASALRHWNFQGLNIKAFWGLPYVMAVVSLVTRISDRDALILVSYCSGIATIVLAHRLWGGWVAGFFMVLNFDWMQRLFLCGSEPLFMALVFGAFLAARKQHWLLSALLAAFSVTVRPLGIFVLAGIGLTLLWKRDFRNFSLATLTGLVIGGLYAIPMTLYFKTPFANVQSYQQMDWQGGHLLSWPFFAIVKSMHGNRPPLTNLLLTWGWIVFVLAGFLVILLSRQCRLAWSLRSVELIFALSYLAFLYTYNSPRWIVGSFPRYSIPVLPLILWALIDWLPKDRRVLWGLAAVSPVLAACSAIGIRNVAAMIHRGM
jgi:hypothetical protein